MNREITQYNRLPMHTMIMNIHTNENDSRNSAVNPCSLKNNCYSKNVMCLDTDTDATDDNNTSSSSSSSSKWIFQLCNTVEEGLDFVLNNSNNNSNDKWKNTCIPSNWMLLNNINDNPTYTNIKYPFKCNPPIIPYPNNPTGVYRLETCNEMLSKDWIMCNVEENNKSRHSIVFHGVESSFFIFWNSYFIGFSKDSRLPAEFDTTPCIKLSSYDKKNNNKNTLEVVACRWNDGSCLEDQDHWLLAGIFRSVYLARHAPNADVWDYRTLECDALTGRFTVEVSLTNNNSNKSNNNRMIVAKLHGDEQICLR